MYKVEKTRDIEDKIPPAVDDVKKMATADTPTLGALFNL
jgi:hypothetical protein